MHYIVTWSMMLALAAADCPVNTYIAGSNCMACQSCSEYQIVCPGNTLTDVSTCKSCDNCWSSSAILWMFVILLLLAAAIGCTMYPAPVAYIPIHEPKPERLYKEGM